MPVLTTLTLPDHSTYSIAANDYDLRGNPHRVVLPTRGEIHYEWQSVALPPTVHPTLACSPLGQLDPWIDLGEPHEDLGVRQRILYNQQMAKLDQTTSLIEIGRTQYCWTPILLGGPGCYDGEIYEQMRQTTLDADGTRTESYFSVYNAANSLVRQPVWGTSLLEYGMPYTRDPARADPFGDGLFLSTEVSQCDSPDPDLDPFAQCPTVPQNCGPVLRRTYVSYEQDIGFVNPLLPTPGEDRRGYWSSQNRRQTAQRTVFLDDCTSSSEATCAWTKEAWSDFDRFGHFRVKETTSSFALGTRIERTEYNAAGPAAPHPWPLGNPWVLGTFSFRETEQTSVVPCSGVPGSWGFPVTQTTREESCFDPDTGFLKATRLRTTPTGGVSSTDLVHRFVDTSDPADGLPELEAWYGGDGGGAPTGDLCLEATFTGVPTSFAQSHEYQNGILTKTRWLDGNGNPLPFYSLRQEIDLATGLVKKIHDPADLGDSLFTEQGYDVMLRLTSVKPSVASGLAWDYFDHINAGGSSFAAVRHFACANGTDCHASGTPLLQREWQFDGFGRPHLELQRASIDPEKWDRRVTWYDGEGRKTFASEWTGPNDPNWADYGTKFEYDFAGRLKRTSHEMHLVYDLDPVTWTYTGAREVERKVNVGTAIAGNSVTQQQVTTRETYDGFGRLVKVEEPSGDSLSALVPTSYHYDVGSRLIGSMTEPLDATDDQQRCWTYDPRGLLQSERHPELGASGQGTTSYSQYDALGNAREKTTGSRIASFVFDRANRLQTVSEGPLASPTRTLKAFSYGTSSTGGDWVLGKVQTADSWNYLPRVGTSDARARLEERFEYRGQGGAKSKRRLQLFNPDALSSVFHTSLTSLHAFSHEESFDPLGQRLQLIYPTCVSGTLRCTTGTTPSRTVASTYELGRLQNVVGWTLAGSAGVTYHPGGMWAEIRHANGITDRQGRDPGFRPRPGWLETRQLGQVLWKPGTFSYDAAGNILTIGASEGGGTDRFAYDGVSRLKQARMYVPQREPESLSLLRDGFETGDHSRWAPHAGESIPNYEIEVLLDYTFDEHGNLLSWSKGGVSRPQPTDGATNHLTRGTFDAAGNLTILDDPGVQGDRVTFSFDVLNRIVARQGETDAKPLYFLYTADDERALILDPDAQRSEWFRYSLRDFGGRLVRMVTEVNPTEIAPEPVFAAEQDVIFRGGAPLAFVGSNSSTGLELSLDHLGSIRLATNSGGQVLGWRKFYPFGEQATYPPDQPTLTLMFTGHERQSFNGLTADEDLDYMHARFASPMTGRFLSADPIAGARNVPQSWNRYSHARNSPLSRIDPDGRADRPELDFERRTADEERRRQAEERRRRALSSITRLKQTAAWQGASPEQRLAMIVRTAALNTKGTLEAVQAAFAAVDRNGPLGNSVRLELKGFSLPAGSGHGSASGYDKAEHLLKNAELSIGLGSVGRQLLIQAGDALEAGQPYFGGRADPGDREANRAGVSLGIALSSGDVDLTQFSISDIP